MSYDYLLLALAVALLWMPTALVLPAATREKIRQPSRRQDDGLGSLLRSPFNWIDLLRAAGGAWLARESVFHFVETQDDLARVFQVAQALLFLSATLAQTLWLGPPLRLIGPLFFLAGLTTVVSEPLVGGFGVALGLTCALLVRRLSLTFVFVPVFLGVLGKVFGTLGIPTLANAVAWLVPITLGFVLSTRLAFVRRPRARQEG